MGDGSLNKDSILAAVSEMEETINCFSRMLAILLKPNMGMIIVMPDRGDQSMLQHSKYLFWHDAKNKQIAGHIIPSDHPMFIHEHGVMVQMGNAVSQEDYGTE
jgi:hypothetical protein